MTLDANVARLARIPPFSLMPREAVQLIAFSCVRQRLRAGDHLFRVGEEGDAGYFVLSGAILLEDPRSPAGRSRRVESDALIGESALYASAVRRVDARAVEDAVVTRIPRETFRRVLSEFPDAAVKIRATLAERMRRLVEGLDAARARSFDVARAEPGTST